MEQSHEDKDDVKSESKRRGGKGRRRVEISFIENKSRRNITFSKRKAGIMKKAYELATLTGTQVLLLVASENGHVYTFATPSLQPMINDAPGRSLIRSLLNQPISGVDNESSTQETHQHRASPPLHLDRPFPDVAARHHYHRPPDLEEVNQMQETMTSTMHYAPPDPYASPAVYAKPTDTSAYIRQYSQRYPQGPAHYMHRAPDGSIAHYAPNPLNTDYYSSSFLNHPHAAQ